MVDGAVVFAKEEPAPRRMVAINKYAGGRISASYPFESPVQFSIIPRLKTKGFSIMLLYTIVPPEIIFEEEDNDELPPEIEMKDGSVSLLCQMLPGGEIRINRVISSNPQDYLKPDWQPGSVFKR
jgi:hypothetical protein